MVLSSFSTFQQSEIKTNWKTFLDFLGSNPRLLFKSLSLLTFIEILKFAKDRVVMRTYDDSRESASKMQMNYVLEKKFRK